MAISENPRDFSADWIGTGSARDYFALMKPRLMSLVIFTALVGLVVAPGTIHPFIGAVAVLAIAVGAGASGVLNMWYDADIDAVMTRTLNRPIPAGRVTRNEALAFGVVMSAFSVLVLGLLVNWLSAALLAFTIFFYAVIYTIWLKRSTPQNIVIGGAAGALPPMIGWAAATGTVSLESFVLFAVIFLWTPPHFWALALVKSGDYARAGVPMMPNVRGAESTRRQIVLYTILLLPAGVAPWLMGFAGPVYGLASIALGLAFVALAVDVWKGISDRPAERAALRLFLFSLIYLFGLFAVLLVEHLARPLFGV